MILIIFTKNEIKLNFNFVLMITVTSIIDKPIKEKVIEKMEQNMESKQIQRWNQPSQIIDILDVYRFTFM